MSSAVDRFLVAIETAAIPDADVWTEDAVLDATVPNWRLEARGADAIRDEYAGWFKDPATFNRIDRTALPDGELLEYELTWEEDGVPHAAHHLHRVRVTDGRIAADTVFCGGRWPASLLAEMEEARGGV